MAKRVELSLAFKMDVIEMLGENSYSSKQALAVNVEVLREKILELPKKFEMEEFSPSQGWIENFKNRPGQSTLLLSGETANVNEGTVEQRKEQLSILVEGYKPEEHL